MRVSVVVPVYNHQRYVTACLASICDQGWPDLELIVIDDGSKDDSWSLIEGFPYPRGVLPKLERSVNRGASTTLNVGLARATGEVIALCNSDDVFLPGRLTTMVRALESSSRDFAFSRVRCLDGHGRDVTASAPYAQELARKQDEIAAMPAVGFALMLTNVAISTGNFLFRRSLLDALGGFRPYKLVHDWDFILRALLLTEPLFVDAPLYGYRLHGENSFPSLLSSVAAVECPELMRRFLKAASAARPRNALCPSPLNWPGFFEAFVEEHHYEGYLQEWERIDAPWFPLGVETGARVRSA